MTIALFSRFFWRLLIKLAKMKIFINHFQRSSEKSFFYLRLFKLCNLLYIFPFRPTTLLGIWHLTKESYSWHELLKQHSRETWLFFCFSDRTGILGFPYTVTTGSSSKQLKVLVLSCLRVVLNGVYKRLFRGIYG